MKAAIFIPAHNPDERLITYCEDLVKAGFTKIIVLNDGSDEEFRPVFDKLTGVPEVVMLSHAINLGKGRALKNGFNYFLSMEDAGKYSGVITADADGQHLIKDVIKVQEAMDRSEDTLILGARDFNAKIVPPKSRFGNRSSILLMRLLHGMKLRDTQTGLRGIPTSILPEYLDLYGERFEYETSMLIKTSRNHIKYEEVPIETVYENNNKDTHFRDIADSVKVVGVMFSTFLKYLLSSGSSALIDIGMFRLMLVIVANFALPDGTRITIATIVARIISSLFNFMMNKNLVFNSEGNRAVLLVKYYVLCVIQMACSAGLVAGLFALTHVPETMLKIVVDAVLFLISFRVQKRFIFR